MNKPTCKHCGNDDEFIEVSQATGIIQYYHSQNGNKTYNSQMYDMLSEKQNKWMICVQCNKRGILLSDFKKYKQENSK